MTKYKRNIKAVFFRFKKYLCKAFSNFDFNSTIKKKIQWDLQLFGNTFRERFSLTRQAENPNSFIHVLI